MRPQKLRIAGVLALSFFVLLAPRSLAGSVGPSPYLSFPDSPWAGLPFTYFHLEDMEDGVFNVPGATATGATGVQLAGGTFTDSVDGDDGVIDGSGTNGQSQYTQNGATGITYSFDGPTLGGLPTHAGLVWTDLSGVQQVFFEAFDQNGASLGVLNAGALNDGSSVGETAEDRFLGWENPGGISSIRVYQSGSDMEVDQIQYGLLVPEPGGLILGGLALVSLALFRVTCTATPLISTARS